MASYLVTGGGELLNPTACVTSCNIVFTFLYTNTTLQTKIDLTNFSNRHIFYSNVRLFYSMRAHWQSGEF